MAASVTILIGTTKGAFMLTGEESRKDWHLSGPHCDGWGINHVIGDAQTGRIWAAGGGEWFGAGVWRSDDNGQSWTLAKLSRGELDGWAKSDPYIKEKFATAQVEAQFDEELKAVWSLNAAHGLLYAGANPAALFVSRDNGETWEKIEALSDHPSRDSWEPGGAGLVLHTIVSDPGRPERLWTAISAAGVFATEDGGASWERRNQMSNADACAHHDHPAGPRDGETGHCVHNMVRAPDKDLMYQQNHHGVFRSTDGGRIWNDVTEGLPSAFGFPIAMHPRDPQTIWVLPLNGDTEGRYPPDASAAVWKSGDGGATWKAMRNGLPEKNCFFTVLRQAMATDTQDPAGVYFGTNTGSVYASADAGETWEEIARHLPTILSVETLEGTVS